MARTQFQNLRVYKCAEEIADPAWETVTKWDHLLSKGLLFGISFGVQNLELICPLDFGF